VASGITSARRQRALLLHVVGAEVQEIFETLPEKGDDGDYEAAANTLKEYFRLRVNHPYERHLFRQIRQRKEESVDQFVMRLRIKAQLCDFGEQESEYIRDQVIDKCVASKLRVKLLEKQNVTLVDVQKIALAFEAMAAQASVMETNGAARA
jgi:hypothetical protein